MPVLRKLNISFVFLLALLFSYSFAGSINVNNHYYSAAYLSDNYVVTLSGDNYLVFYNKINSNTTAYQVINIQDLRTADKFGVLFSPQNNNRYLLYGLDDLNRPVSYFYLQDLTIPADSISNIEYKGSGATTVLSSSDFPFTFPSNDFYSLTMPFTGSLNMQFDFLASPLDVYEITSFSNGIANLGSLLFDSGGSISPFTNPFTQQETNDFVLNLFNSPAIVDILPSDYTSFFIQYNEDYGFTAYFYSYYNQIYGRLFLDSNDEPDYYNFGIRGISSSPSSLFKSMDLYQFSSLDGVNYTFDKVWSDSISGNTGIFSTDVYFDYYSEPIIYASPSLQFDIFNDSGINTGTFAFDVSSFDIYDSDNNLITSDSILSQNKDNNSIWSIINNIFNPSSPSDMSQIESYHNDINSKADFDELYSYYTRNTSFFSDLAAVRWIILANNALYEHFAGFLLMCCFFITLSRIINS